MRGDFAGKNGKNCEVPINNIPTEVSFSIKPSVGSYANGSHKHFNDVNDYGTGKLTSASPPWQNISSNNTHANFITNEKGKIDVSYKAGFYGLTEIITTKITNPTTGNESGLQTEFDIKVPDMIHIDTSGKTYKVAGTFRSPCDKQHNDKASGEGRKSSFVTPHMKTLIEKLNATYYNELGHHLSFNDGSLEFGGVFDAGVDKRTADPCHKSHRKGIDIDVNSGYVKRVNKLDSDGNAIINEETGEPETVRAKVQPNCEDLPSIYKNSLNCYVEHGEFKQRRKRRDILDDLVKERVDGLIKIKEDPLHYRAE